MSEWASSSRNFPLPYGEGVPEGRVRGSAPCIGNVRLTGRDHPPWPPHTKGGKSAAPPHSGPVVLSFACLLCCLSTGLPARAQDAPAKTAAPSPTPGTRRALIICGLPGDDEHRKLFAGTVEKLHKVLIGRYGFAASEVLVRFGVKSEQADGPALAGARGLSDREGIAADVAEIRNRLRPEDTLWVIVMGHTHYDGRHSHLNIPGLDLDERAFAKLFSGLKSREQVFFITTAASGFFLKPLAAPGRIVITATEADREVNETLFAHALAETLANPSDGIDRDKDGKTSVFELYLAVVTAVMKQYVEAENLPTEHAKLDDNGDGHGSELQETYLPPELGGRESQVQSKSKSKSQNQTAERKFGPKDDGYLASITFLEPPTAAKP
jgi:hypothetical protein